MIIRKATIQDSEIIAAHMLLAMQDVVYGFIGVKDSTKAKAFLRYFVEQENNQYSYKNCFVAEEENEVIGTLNIYDGAKLEQLRAPVLAYLKQCYAKEFNPEKETAQGEYYIDTIGVSATHQGKGIGTKLLKYIIQTYVNDNKYTLGLLVDEENPNAEKLYLSLGFELVGYKGLLGKRLKHLQMKP
ncbi:GNAT family N-acetyltransferase [Pedobacter arcticus]|uniref:GNAT family N-acetyltransferase n=1 Tax=Pedobacter arcticus TaxID=752140 RepID=UPI0002F2FE77|nr:GNAT family N-acetyltransferase [Pedobacter arcticus]